MNRSSFSALCALASTVLAVAGSPAHAQLGGPAGIVIPYAGKLELDGALVNGSVDFEFGVAPDAATPAPTTPVNCVFSFPDIPVTNGEFVVSIAIPVARESCVKGKDVHLVVRVRRSDQDAAPLVLLGTQRVTPVVAAATSGRGDFAVTGAVTAKSLVVSDPQSTLVADFNGLAIGSDTIKATGSATNKSIILLPKGSGIVEVTGSLAASSLSTSSVVVTSNDNIGTTNIADFKALNETQGVGIGFNTVRATGSNPNVALFLEGKGTGDVVVNDNLQVNGSFSTACRAGFTAVDGGRICISTLMQPRNGGVVGSPVPMQDRADAAIRTCRRQRARVCTHTDIQQVCGNFLVVGGLDLFNGIGTQSFWYGDLSGNDLFEFNTNGFASCSDNLDNQSAGAASGISGSALYRCCY